MTKDAIHYRWEDMPREKVTDMLERRLITGDRTMVAQIFLAKGCVVPKHSHDNEQISLILEGSLRFTLGEEQDRTVIVKAGEVLHLPSNLPHRADALEDTVNVDVFTPPRQDWLDKTDDYLRQGTR
jgi:quercetin dioxygenase-like cupin family protein